MGIDWEGTKTQVAAFASGGGDVSKKLVVYVSSGLTTNPDGFYDKLGNGNSLFYKLNAEAFIMSSGLPYTILKPCGLGDGPAGKHKLIVGHDDKDFNIVLNHNIQRDDVARVIVEAVRNPFEASGLRFDLCSQLLGRPTTNIVSDVFQRAMYPSDHRIVHQQDA